ncbi:MAG: PAS domain S-box protein [Deltaproteobacteria bacterium]|nr:PAS domain S-box protein [Deltaproteobacteria bacterium]
MTWKVFWGKSEYFGIVSVPVLWFLFVFQYTRTDRWLTSRNVALLWVIPVITIVMAITNGWHGLMWSNIAPSPGRETEVLIYTHGTWFWVHVSYCYALMVLGTFQLFKTTFANIRMYRLQSLSILVAVLIPWVGNGIYLLGYSPIPGLDLTPLAFLVSGIVIAWSLLRQSFLDIVPVARGMLFENMDDGFIVLDTQNRVVDINPAAKGLLDKNNESIVGKKVNEVIPGLPDMGSGTQEQPVSEAEFVLGNESAPRVFDCKFNLLRNRHGAPTGRLIVLRDISGKKEAEKALRESEEKYRLLVENASDAIFVAQDEVVKFPNPRTTEIVGYSPEDLAEKPFTRLIHPEDRDMVLDRHKRRLQAEELPSSYSFRVISKAGEERWVELNTVAITWEGRPATLNFLRDITPQRKLEAQLMHAQKMEAVGTMASGIAHNFRNILAAISMHSQAIEMKYKEDKALQEMSGVLIDYVERGSQLVSSLTQFSRKKGDKIFHPLDLSKMAEETYQLISESFDKMIHVSMDVRESLPWGITRE